MITLCQNALWISGLILANLSATALASGYHCKLPQVTADEIQHGKHTVDTSNDPTVDFQVRLAADGDKAYIEGSWFGLVKGAGMDSYVDVGPGYIDVLTIYGSVITPDGGFYAVESRHIVGGTGTAMVDLMVGSCTAW